MKIGPSLQNDGLIGPLRGGRDRGLRGELIVLLFCYSNGLLSMQSEARVAYHASMIIIISTASSLPTASSLLGEQQQQQQQVFAAIVSIALLLPPASCRFVR